MPSGKKKTFSDKKLAKMRWLWLNTSLNKSIIADKLGLTKTVVIRWTRDLPAPKNIIKPKRLKTLSERQILEIRTLWVETDIGKKPLAKKLKISECSVFKYLKGLECNYPERKPTGFYPKGSISWNKGTIGLTKANKTSFKKGQPPNTLKYKCGEPQIVNRPKRKRKEVWTRIPERRAVENHRDGRISHPEKRVYYSRYLWENKYGTIPKGLIVYHKDGDPLNNDLGNLTLLTRSTLLKLNRKARHIK